MVPVKIIRDTHKQLRKDYREYKKQNGDTTFTDYITNVLNYEHSEAKKIVKEGNKLLYNAKKVK